MGTKNKCPSCGCHLESIVSCEAMYAACDCGCNGSIRHLLPDDRSDNYSEHEKDHVAKSDFITLTGCIGFKYAIRRDDVIAVAQSEEDGEDGDLVRPEITIVSTRDRTEWCVKEDFDTVMRMLSWPA